MATILEFRSAAVQREARTGPDATAGAEIIIFPGVRYERWDDTPVEAAAETDDDIDHAPKPRRRAAAVRSTSSARKKPRAERKRDILEIPD